jgi:competence ComEA-like helix-hairpin-helix protein
MKKLIKVLLSFSLGERVGLFLLLSMLLLFILWPHVVPLRREPSPQSLERIKRMIDSLSQPIAEADKDEIERGEASPSRSRPKRKVTARPLFAFDPNTADSETFEQLGFSPKQAAVIINYRATGGVFRRPDDFKKMYVVSAELFEQLQPYIQIAEAYGSPKTKRDSSTFPKQGARIAVALNSADTTALLTVRGIGSYTAAQIVKYREQLGGFVHIQQLLELRGMSEERFEQIASQLTLDTALVTRIDLLTADESLLRKHPYIGAYAARGIVHFRDTQGYCDVDALINNNILKAEQAEQLRPYCVKSGT